MVKHANANVKPQAGAQKHAALATQTCPSVAHRGLLAVQRLLIHSRGTDPSSNFVNPSKHPCKHRLISTRGASGGTTQCRHSKKNAPQAMRPSGGRMRTASQIASAVQRATMASDDVHVNEAATDVSCRWKQHAATSHAVHLLVSDDDVHECSRPRRQSYGCQRQAVTVRSAMPCRPCHRCACVSGRTSLCETV